ncbi:Uncharacterised protein [Neisseria gonorrhoeae]|uniref:Uncharacterized protein n=1 Tax=Neisseria gonorrhoeae TaxID=485 RepID=A0A378W3Z7_NEIGO|nr:Uncharacterised protein [Neisseria gonorrhoeae]
MFQHTGRYIKHRPMYRPDLEGVPSQIKSDPTAPKGGFQPKGNTMKEYKVVIYQESLLSSLFFGAAKVNPVNFSAFLNKQTPKAGGS